MVACWSVISLRLFDVGSIPKSSLANFLNVPIVIPLFVSRRIQPASAILFTKVKNKLIGSSKSNVNLGLRLILC